VTLMRKRATIPTLALLLAACGGPALPASDPGPASPEVNEAPAAVTPATDPVIDDQPVWDGFAATNEPSSGLAIYTRGEIAVYDSPRAAEPWTTVEPLTILGTVTVLSVVGEPVDGWAEVMLPMRPNGSTGWARTSDVWFYVADSEILVDLSDRHLTYLVDGVVVLETDVGIGSDYNQTPTGEYFVTDSVTLSNPNSAWGPHALGLSARSDTITSFYGGDGIIGIHGTNNPSSIGANISHGCLRLPNEMITLLHEMVPVGTKVEIRT